MKKKIIIAAALTAVIAGFGAVLIANRGSFVAEKTAESETAGTKKLMYWAAVADYWSIKENITLNDLKTTSLVVEESQKDDLSDFINGNGDVTTKDTAEIQSGLQKNEIAIISWDKVTPNLKTLSVEGKYLWEKKDVPGYPLKKNVSDKDIEQFDANKITKVTATGDVILGRTVAKKMADYGVMHPWEKVYRRLLTADITFSDLEVPLSNRVSPPYEGMSFVAPAEAVKGLVKAGIDIVGLANNHSTNFGTEVFTDTLKSLTKSGIRYCGGGKDLAEAEKAAVIEKNGLKWAFLDYNSIIGAQKAGQNTPGTAEFALKPWAEEDSEEDARKIEEAVKKAKENADVVIVEFHWGVEYETKQIPSQENLAHRVIDAGADLVVGTHPHAVQGSEVYKGKYITYSLGNFIFDQEWSQGTKEGTVLESYFYGNRNVSSNLAPVLIKDYNQPSFLTRKEGDSIIRRIQSVSLGL